MRRSTALLVVILLASRAGGGSVEVSDAWARPSPGVADTAAFYVSLVNQGDVDDVLLGAESDRCAEAQLHESVMEEGTMSMSHLPSIVLASGSDLEMAPAGIDIICMGVTEPLTVGEAVSVTLTFEQSGDLTVPVPVEER